jgi:hypothetical protein
MSRLRAELDEVDISEGDKLSGRERGMLKRKVGKGGYILRGVICVEMEQHWHSMDEIGKYQLEARISIYNRWRGRLCGTPSPTFPADLSPNCGFGRPYIMERTTLKRTRTHVSAKVLIRFIISTRNTPHCDSTEVKKKKLPIKAPT